MKFLLIAIILFFNLVLSSSAQASTCRNYDDQKVCIVRIKRSAKYYWRYRTEIKINGIKQPMMIYDCRQQKKFTKEGVGIPFKSVGIENFICGTLDNS